MGTMRRLVFVLGVIVLIAILFGVGLVWRALQVGSDVAAPHSTHSAR
jgi:hypothetical protein